MERQDVIVVGNGLAGLTAAATLSAAGRAALVVGPERRVGGRGTSVDREGFILNEGPHAVYLDGAGAAVLRKLGVPIDGLAPVLAGAQIETEGGGLAQFPSGPASLARTKAVSGRGRLDLARTLAFLPRVRADRHASESAEAWVCQQTDRDDARSVLRAIVRVATYTAALDELSADAAISQLQMVLKSGVSYVHGGWRTLVSAVAARTGGQLADEKVVAIAPDGDGWVVRTKNVDRWTRTVILAPGGPAAVARLIPGLVLIDAGPMVEAAVLDLGLARVPECRFQTSAVRPLYLSVHSPPARLAPDGRALVSLLRYLAPDDRPSPESCRAELESFAERAGIGGDDVVMARYLHRMTVAHGSPRPGNGGFRGRPAVVLADHPGLFIAGDWVGESGLLADAAIASGAEAASSVARFLDRVASRG